MVTELRVHGVSGTPAEEVLDRPLLYRVAGDADAAFLRPRPDYNTSTGPGGAKLEAYQWGRLTAGAAARALWLLLLPFMLANLTIWLRPPSGPVVKALARAVSRIFALSMTALFVLSMIGISVDLVAWQCAAPGNTCATGRTWLRFLTAGFFAPLGRRMAVLALVPVAAICLLWFLARRTWSRYEAYTGTTDVDGDGLGAPGFWRGKPQVGRLRQLHIGTAFGTLDAALTGPLVWHDRDPGAAVLCGLALLTVLACLVAVCLRGMMHRDRARSWARPFAATVRTAAVLLTAVTLIYLMLPRADWQSSGGLPGYGLGLSVLAAAQMVLLLVLAVIVALRRASGQFLGGLAAPAVGSMAVGFAVAFSAGLSYRVADWLDRSAVPSSAQSPGRATTLQPPPVYAWTGLCFLLALLVVGAVVAWTMTVATGRLRPAAAASTDAAFPGGRQRDPGRAEAIDRAVVDARLTEPFASGIGWGYAVITVAAVITTGLAIGGVSPMDLVTRDSRTAAVLSFVVNLGGYAIGLFVLGLVVVGLLAYRYPGVRRIVGVLWDLGTFWPRAAHPLAPPCYAERVVPELAVRAAWLADDAGGGGVVLSGHSQGSVLVAATVLQLPAACRPRVALLTYGSPLRRLYCRLFPAYVNPDLLEQISEELTDFLAEPRWVNLYRATDPIGGPVGSVGEPVVGSVGEPVVGSVGGPVGARVVQAVPVAPGAPATWTVPVEDRVVVDPPRFDTDPGNTVPCPVEGHSWYQYTAGFALAVADLVNRI